ncbi:TMV resistance protein N-like [Prunus avium]|uniref:TMV resistance protein N-like n=1 Tax=Prunus avium TaxID=42229 RepID=A0A6P5T5U9_PRUAV|nr:TMV resistance protein N-like [Prunus avium]
MALVKAADPQTSSSNASRYCHYHVFLSFRGQDTRKTFTDHLYTALVNAGFRTFRDDDEVDKGEGMEPELQKAIKHSRTSVIVFSKDYASSRWYESKFMKKIVKVIGNKLSRTPLSVAPNLIGMCSRVETINLWLQDGSPDVGVLVIYGMSGIGKTTIAKTVYNSNFRIFEGSSFLENIKEVSQQPNGLVQIQTQLLSDILNGRKMKISNVSEGLIKIEDAISSKRVLLVLDDVDHMDQLDAVFQMKDRFYPGSKIIITTRRARLLKAHQVTEVYAVGTLTQEESLELFSWHAFGQDHPVEDYIEYSEKLVDHCGGLPLALKVLGSSLLGESICLWKSALEKLGAIPNGEIINKLRVSYDSLQDDHDRKLFLHIACFFIGMDKDYIAKILDGCDFYTIVGIQNLIDRCLVIIDGRDKVQMHDLIRGMGREIVRLESKEPWKRSRIWHHKDSFKILTEKNVRNMHYLYKLQPIGSVDVEMINLLGLGNLLESMAPIRMYTLYENLQEDDPIPVQEVCSRFVCLPDEEEERQGDITVATTTGSNNSGSLRGWKVLVTTACFFLTLTLITRCKRLGDSDEEDKRGVMFY